MKTKDSQNIPPAAQQHLEQAYQLEQADKISEALQPCEAAIELAPQWADAHNLHGILLEELGRQQEAIAAYRQAVRIDPTFQEAQENLSEAQLEIPDAREAKSIPVDDDTPEQTPNWERVKNYNTKAAIYSTLIATLIIGLPLWLILLGGIIELEWTQILVAVVILSVLYLWVLIAYYIYLQHVVKPITGKGPSGCSYLVMLLLYGFIGWLILAGMFYVIRKVLQSSMDIGDVELEKGMAHIIKEAQKSKS